MAYCHPNAVKRTIVHTCPVTVPPALSFLLAAIGCFVFPLLSHDWLWLTPLAIGAIVGAEQDLLPFIATKYFPARSVGKLYGRFYGAFIVGGGMNVIADGALMEAGLSLTAAFDVGSAVLTLAGAKICIALSMAERHDGHPTRTGGHIQ